MKYQKLAYFSFCSILVSSFAFLVSPISAFATEISLSTSATANTSATTTTPGPLKQFRQERIETRNEIKQDIKEVRETVQNMRQDLEATITQARATQAQERKTVWTALKKKQVQMVANRLVKELETRFNIIQKLKTKISERITAKSAAYDTSAASAKLALFSDAQFQTDLASLKAKIAVITVSETPKDLLLGIRTAADVVRKDLRNLHLFLVEVMKLVATAPKK